MLPKICVDVIRKNVIQCGRGEAESGRDSEAEAAEIPWRLRSLQGYEAMSRTGKEIDRAEEVRPDVDGLAMETADG